MTSRRKVQVLFLIENVVWSLFLSPLNKISFDHYKGLKTKAAKHKNKKITLASL